MEPSLIFSISNTYVLLGWILLLVLPKWKYTYNYVLYVIILLLALTYLRLIATTITDFNPESFSSLENVKILFKNDTALTAGWVHYLAFDLFVGLHIVKESKHLKIPRWQYTLCLPFTFMFGPIGLLLFFLFKSIKK